VDQFDLEHAGAAEDHQRQGRDGKVHDGVRMWHYMALQEGTLGVDPNTRRRTTGACRRSSTSTPMRRFAPIATAT
jgi:hypothetical protein